MGAMNRTSVYIICSPRPRVGKTLMARLLTEFLLLQHGRVTAFDININEPSLLDFLPHQTETANVDDTFGQMELMDRLIVNDGTPKVVDVGFHAFDPFFRMLDEIGFVKEAEYRGVKTVILNILDRDRTSHRAWTMLQDRFRYALLVPVDNEQVLLGEPPDWLGQMRMFRISALPGFLKTYIERQNFSFVHYLKTSNDKSAELYGWTRDCFFRFRELEIGLSLRGR